MDKDVKKILDDAIIVVSGYSFSKCELGYRIFSSRTKNATGLATNRRLQDLLLQLGR